MSPIGLGVVWVMGAVYAGLGLLMIFRPLTWLEWWMNKTGKAWGLRTVVVDERRFRKSLRWMGLTFLTIGAGFPVLIIWSHQ